MNACNCNHEMFINVKIKMKVVHYDQSHIKTCVRGWEEYEDRVQGQMDLVVRRLVWITVCPYCSSVMYGWRKHLKKT